MYFASIALRLIYEVFGDKSSHNFLKLKLYQCLSNKRNKKAPTRGAHLSGAVDRN